jgi:hypothetical protein
MDKWTNLRPSGSTRRTHLAERQQLLDLPPISWHKYQATNAKVRYEIMKGPAKHTECHVVCTDIRFSIYLDNEDSKSGLTEFAVVLTDRLVIFCSVDKVWRIQVHWPGSCSAGCSASFWKIRMPSSEFTSV